jgi:predicted GNAT family N-acyltransferase
MLIQGKILSYGNDLSDVYMIRRNVFVEELHLQEEIEFDGQDEMAMHVIVYEEEGSKKPVATGRISFDGAICEIGHIAVLKEYRGKKYGDFAVRMLLNKAFTAGVFEVSCIVLDDAAAFFENIGFYKTNEIVKMVQNYKCHKMTINRKDVITTCHK